MKSLFEVKAIITTHFKDVISNQSKGKGRFLYEIREMNVINDKILGFYHMIG
jgi:hypothetical protein